MKKTIKLFMVLSISTFLFGSVFGSSSQLDTSTDQDTTSDMVVADSTPSADAPAESSDDTDVDDNPTPIDDSQETLTQTSFDTQGQGSVANGSDVENQNSSYGTYQPAN